jgi:hypothetical protein
MDRFKFGLGVAVLVSGTLYVMAGFVFWDFGWVRDMGSWRTDQRLMFLYMMFIIPAILGGAAGSLSPSEFIKAVGVKT